MTSREISRSTRLGFLRLAPLNVCFNFLISFRIGKQEVSTTPRSFLFVSRAMRWLCSGTCHISLECIIKEHLYLGLMAVIVDLVDKIQGWDIPWLIKAILQ